MILKRIDSYRRGCYYGDMLLECPHTKYAKSFVVWLTEFLFE